MQRGNSWDQAQVSNEIDSLRRHRSPNGRRSWTSWINSTKGRNCWGNSRTTSSQQPQKPQKSREQTSFCFCYKTWRVTLPHFRWPRDQLNCWEQSCGKQDTNPQKPTWLKQSKCTSKQATSGPRFWSSTTRSARWELQGTEDPGEKLQKYQKQSGKQRREPCYPLRFQSSSLENSSHSQWCGCWGGLN